MAFTIGTKAPAIYCLIVIRCNNNTTNNNFMLLLLFAIVVLVVWVVWVVLEELVVQVVLVVLVASSNTTTTSKTLSAIVPYQQLDKNAKVRESHKQHQRQHHVNYHNCHQTGLQATHSQCHEMRFLTSYVHKSQFASTWFIQFIGLYRHIICLHCSDNFSLSCQIHCTNHPSKVGDSSMSTKDVRNTGILTEIHFTAPLILSVQKKGKITFQAGPLKLPHNDLAK